MDRNKLYQSIGSQLEATGNSRKSLGGPHPERFFEWKSRTTRSGFDRQRRSHPIGVGKRIGNYELLGETRDDAAGECFDKTARLLNLSYPGGPAIEQAAENHVEIELPRPMINSNNYDFSFSGLKTAVLYKVKEDESRLEDERFVQSMAYEIQEAVTEVLTKKTLKAARDYQVNSIIVGGGVAANQRLRERIKGDFKVHIPSLKLCTDNGAMIAATAFYQEEKTYKKLKSKAEFKALRFT